MLEDVFTVRRQALERQNGAARVWWHYNRMTLVIMLSALATVALLLHVERHWRLQAEARVVSLADSRMADLACFSTPRSTSIIIAADSQAAATQALIDAGNSAVLVRENWRAAQQVWSRK